MSEDGAIYAIRYRRRAQTDAQEALVRLAELTNADHAAVWYSGLQNALATLVTFPERAPIAAERRFFQGDVRVLLYQHTPGGAAYRIFYTGVVSEEDAPSVYVLHIRHAAHKPVTRAEARRMEADD